MSNFQQLLIEAKRLINDDHYYGYSGSSSFAYELRLLREGIENHLLETEPESSLKISGKIIQADGELIEKVDDYGCRDEFLPNVQILLSAKEMQSLYDFYKERFTGNIGDHLSHYIFANAVNMGQVAKAMGNPELYEESVRIHSNNLNNMQMLDILSFYLEQDRVSYVLQMIENTVWEERFQSEMLDLKEKVFLKNGDPGALKEIQKQQFIYFRSADKLKIYLKTLDDESRNRAVNEALEYAEDDVIITKDSETAEDIARNQQSDTKIHGENGKIRAGNSYGNDHSPPKDRK